MKRLYFSFRSSAREKSGLSENLRTESEDDCEEAGNDESEKQIATKRKLGVDGVRGLTAIHELDGSVGVGRGGDQAVGGDDLGHLGLSPSLSLVLAGFRSRVKSFRAVYFFCALSSLLNPVR